MKVLIHAYPGRMWYVEEILAPALRAQGADVEIWNDTDRKGNLVSCMEAFASRTGDGGTWHIQDDVLVCHDFVERAETYDGVVYGFCSEHFTDDPLQTGVVYVPDAWHSFQCVRIPDAYARECAEWFFTDAQFRDEWKWMVDLRKFDDTFFTYFLNERHARETVTNAKPNLVDHVDILLGGSAVNAWRGFWVRAHYWEDEYLIEDLKTKLKERA